jgi:hypothetical protein
VINIRLLRLAVLIGDLIMTKKKSSIATKEVSAPLHSTCNGFEVHHEKKRFVIINPVSPDNTVMMAKPEFSLEDCFVYCSSQANPLEAK